MAYTDDLPLIAHNGASYDGPLLAATFVRLRQGSYRLYTLGLVNQLVKDEVRGGAGIIYVATRRSATQLARLLRDRNIAAQAYHGGLPTPERHQIQERFMQGELDVVVATNAFGMGVDKAEIRFVLHYDPPL
ncbi:MAG: helicase-related protein [Chloroflexota bacterium]|nr:hypothetical protein [Chloroflexota bacterium]